VASKSSSENSASCIFLLSRLKARRESFHEIKIIIGCEKFPLPLGSP